MIQITNLELANRINLHDLLSPFTRVQRVATRTKVNLFKFYLILIETDRKRSATRPKQCGCVFDCWFYVVDPLPVETAVGLVAGVCLATATRIKLEFFFDVRVQTCKLANMDEKQCELQIRNWRLVLGFVYTGAVPLQKVFWRTGARCSFATITTMRLDVMK